MTQTTEELANKIIYLKDNGYMPTIDNEDPRFQNVVQKFYFGSKYSNSCDPFWFRLTFINYNVSDEFVHEVNRQYKRYQILNISKGEF